MHTINITLRQCQLEARYIVAAMHGRNIAISENACLRTNPHANRYFK